ncbi:MAG: FMN-binding negative transcriptional regulator [Flavobacteriaceae bacterium]|nr:FMN-binding negative transcriptional regulator [Flavobacteriaceae bacterium]
MHYPPPHHTEVDQNAIVQLVKAYPFGSILTAKEDRPYITHLPIIYKEKSAKPFLVAHIDANNPQLDTLVDGACATAVFQGPDCYISPTVYQSAQLPTWNYIIAHLQGKVRLLTKKNQKVQSLVDMTAFLEGEEASYALQMDDPKMHMYLDYIVVFEIEVDQMIGRFKFSQDKDAKDYELAKEALIRSQQKEVRSFLNKIIPSRRK